MKDFIASAAIVLSKSEPETYFARRTGSTPTVGSSRIKISEKHSNTKLSLCNEMF
jgi:hypothetical protein